MRIGDSEVEISFEREGIDSSISVERKGEGFSDDEMNAKVQRRDMSSGRAEGEKSQTHEA